jgi:hypothetical protein
MKTSAFLQEVAFVLEMLVTPEPEGALARASLNALIQRRRRFIESPTTTNWELCVKAGRQLKDDMERPARLDLDEPTRQAVEFAELKRRGQPRTAKGVAFKPLRGRKK